ncbi:DUF4199 domain-containing protein [Microvirga sp. STR05]|uniref:DUF4199 domain-containing protein n=1 Tax=Hymenobacter duratus TaxID=2771356 RepID=A0ABR8JQL5_9BACT|nr:DUF4199 domain-containing protein [Hymenobacter duratus]MBD2716844.1 DUF4199 domain-containing protein [Hymenobacter duratus]MBR7951760.1 DUF4199 domain-containing protein [Microvirga sp. STR05]
MNDARISLEGNGVRYGLLTALGMVVYFIVAALLGLADRIEFSFLNFAIMVVGICLSIHHFKQSRNDRMPYLQGFGTGIVTAIVSSLAFGFFFIIFSLLRPDVMDQIHAQDFFGFELSVTIAFLAILLQGAMAGVIISLIAMQYFKSPDHKPIEGVE